jgi:hypothetical protein
MSAGYSSSGQNVHHNHDSDEDLPPDVHVN